MPIQTQETSTTGTSAPLRFNIKSVRSVRFLLAAIVASGSPTYKVQISLDRGLAEGGAATDGDWLDLEDFAPGTAGQYRLYDLPITAVRAVVIGGSGEVKLKANQVRDDLLTA